VSAASWVKKVGPGKVQFSDKILTDYCKFLTEKIMGFQKFNVAPKFPKMGIFCPKFCIFERRYHIPTERKFSDRLKFRGAVPSLSRRH